MSRQVAPLGRRTTAAIVLIIMTLVLTSCWNRRELNTLGIALALGIDSSPDGTVKVSAQIANVSAIAAKRGNRTAAPVIVIQKTGRTLVEALRKMTTELPRKVYLSHMRMLVISEEVAKQGISRLLDLSRDHEMRGDFYLVIAKDTTAKHVLEIISPMEPMPAQNLYSSLEISEVSWAPTKGVLMNDFIQQTLKPGINPVLPGVMVTHPDSKENSVENINKSSDFTMNTYTTLGVFRNDKLIGWLNESDSKGYNYIRGNVKSSIGVIPCSKEGNIGIEIMKSSSHIKAKFENNQPVIYGQVKLDVNISDVSCNKDITNIEYMKELEMELEQSLLVMLKNVVSHVQQKYKSDIFGFGEAIHRSNPKYWKKIRSQWVDIFPTVPVKLTTRIQIHQTGTQSNTYMNYQSKEMRP
ncbi:Ger(x)C family spore germination protein [Paenibacillus sp. ACRRX]|uniref:Ger(x)C family spore germination protein n=1 Tax=unclassified Paenibacillus TaxID=185978 RepID=UPI001EF4C996|nr:MULTISPECIES: Ger(x)C family spore germination protein [unclassified Paenibacillus]MCG7410084.1 Ger(x)C family spore germination protein [Paenibacillus sp. ACRRX]MDK8183658.1 Ger(x)C family spore germination protein [Paenibacillus sp. UMB4589-SE434]